MRVLPSNVIAQNLRILINCFNRGQEKPRIDCSPALPFQPREVGVEENAPRIRNSIISECIKRRFITWMGFQRKKNGKVRTGIKCHPGG
ncbi:hypothetical protein CEXT_135071 [Caerostris extrusa]|uniref:Uncharacterized protein n=1 Tax=Caerostris extrusa TaxID=172846 RepID=A0AAV4ULJ4_CAEEX|nr:hypothetical protein CEXT_135071 [Caerostris extrusa]